MLRCYSREINKGSMFEALKKIAIKQIWGPGCYFLGHSEARSKKL